ncbi:hypothetical protein [Streptomyces albus]|uniref:PspA-associated protein PspAA n=1 Tax=Streptomyces albus TaxID=1888 RepID=UPI0004CA0A1F|nr:hypothetical protein [Streptomyces albus]
MIARILGDGQYEIAEEHLDRLNRLDAALQSAVRTDDAQAFAAALSALVGTVRELGTRLPDEMITVSDLVLPDEDTSLRQVRDLLTDEGLIPG